MRRRWRRHDARTRTAGPATPRRAATVAATWLLATGLAGLAAGTGTGAADPPAGPAVRGAVPPEPLRERVHWDAPASDGRLVGGVVRLPRARPVDPSVLGGGPPAVTTIHGGGDPDHRLDITFVGDGFTEEELGDYADRVAALTAALLAEPPFDRYAPAISIHRVDVVSPESGVDHDPEFGILRDTALDMGFWCAGIERLLCVDTAKARLFAGLAPGRDLVIAVANSATYGGAGYEDLATVPGANGLAGELLLHELGHALADLGDEYELEGTYDGPEPVPRNVSTLDAEAMASAGTKWAAWLGAPAAGDGVVDAYEGAFLFAEGVHRPTPDSRMRSLNRPFNPPSLEALVLAIHAPLPLVTAATPPGTLAGDEILFAEVLPVDGSPVARAWTVDGVAVTAGPDGTLDLSRHGPPSGTFEVRLAVTDATPLVRDEAARTELMHETRTWVVDRAGCPGDLDSDSEIGFADLVLLLGNWGCAGCVGDLDADGSVGVPDLLFLLQAWGSC